MSILNIFDQEAFSVTSLTDAMREIKYVPGLVGQLGVFQVSNIDTLDVAIEKDKEQNQMILSAIPRGGPGQTFGKNKRTMRNLRLPHFQVDDAIYADEVQAVRAFGEEQAVERLQMKIADRGAEASTFFSLTEEYHRLQIIKDGTVLDSDGTTVLYNFFTEFGETQETAVNFDLDNATPAEGALRKLCMGIHRQMAGLLDGLPYSGITAICGDAFFDDLIAHQEVRDTYKNHAEAAVLRSSYIDGNGQSTSYGRFNIFDIDFVNYRGNSLMSVGTNDCHMFPTGVPNLFRSVYGPADYIDSVNRMGQRLYAKQWRMQNDKGVNLEMQSNVLHYCTRPRVLIPGLRT